MVISTLQKVTVTGNSLTIVIPKKVVDILEIKKGDYLQVSWDEVINRKEKNIPIEEEDLPELE